MIRFIKYLFLLVLVGCLLVIALANRQIVTLSLLTPELAAFTGFARAVEVPLYFVAFGGVAMGLLIGFVWEWIREAKHRHEVNRRHNEVRHLKREVAKLKGEKNAGKDEVLALLEEAPKKAG